MRKVSKWYGFDVRTRKTKTKGNKDRETSVHDECITDYSINSNSSDECSDSTDSSIDPPATRGKNAAHQNTALLKLKQKTKQLKAKTNQTSKRKTKVTPKKRRRHDSESSNDISDTDSASSGDSGVSTSSEDSVVKKYGYLTTTFHHDPADNRLYQVTGVGVNEYNGNFHVVAYRKRYNGNTILI